MTTITGITQTPTGPCWVNLDNTTSPLPASPYWFISDTYISDAPTCSTLSGDGLKYFYDFPTSDHAYRHGVAPALADGHVYKPRNLTRAALIRHGRFLFSDLDYYNVPILSWDIETTGFDPYARDAQILLIVARDRYNEYHFIGAEEQILCDFQRLIHKLQPVILVGHNIFKFDLPYIQTRAARRGLQLSWGRNGKQIYQSNQKITTPRGAISPWYCDGRQVVDTMLATLRGETRGIKSYSLKKLAVHFGIHVRQSMVDASQFATELAKNRDAAIRYALDDVAETLALADKVLPPQYELCRYFPEDLAGQIHTGTASRLNARLVAEALAKGDAVPVPSIPDDYEGAYCEVFRKGRIPNVSKADVSSLYPSIMLGERVIPSKPGGDRFYNLLKDMTGQRLQYKKQPDHVSQARSAALKIAINSFYGYLATKGMNWNDPPQAAQVTKRGRELLKDIIAGYQSHGCEIIEVDTDGVFFKPPSDKQPEEITALVNTTIPDYITLSHEHDFTAVLSVAVKNYATDKQGTVSMYGASLRNNGDEPYLQLMLKDIVQHLIAGNEIASTQIYLDTLSSIKDRSIQPCDIAKTIMLTQKLAQTPRGKKLVEAFGIKQIGKRCTYYIAEGEQLRPIDRYAGDYDIMYYQMKTHRAVMRLRDAYPMDFGMLFPKPNVVSQERLFKHGE